MKKYNETEALKVIKDLFNLLVGDTKRFIVLRNKFKQSVSDYKIDNGIVTTIFFNNVEHSIILQELEAAIESLKTYAARSQKKEKEFNSILNLEGYLPISNSEKKVVKVAKDSSGKLKKVVKETKINKEPKEVKKVKNKNEPTKAAKKVATKQTKKDTIPKPKSSTKTKDKSKELDKFAKVDKDIVAFVDSLSSEKRKELKDRILAAFAKDSKLSITMNNWIKNYPDGDDAVIFMFNTAYSRKPNNTIMKDWYGVFRDYVSAEPTRVETETTETTAETTAETQNIKSNESCILIVRKKLLSQKILTNYKTYSFSNLDRIYNEISLDEPTLNEYEITNQGIEKEKCILQLLETFSQNKIDLSRGAENLELTTSSGYKIIAVFGQTFIINLINLLKFSSGISFGSKLNILGNMSPEKYNEEMKKNKTQLEHYVYNHNLIVDMVGNLLRLDLEEKLKTEYCVKFFNAIAEPLLNSLGWYPVGIDLNDTKKEKKNKDEIKYSISSTEISFVFENTSFNIQKLDPNFSKIHDAILNNDLEALRTLVVTEERLKENIKVLIEDVSLIKPVIGAEQEENLDEANAIAPKGEIKIIDKQVLYNGRIFAGALSTEILGHIAKNDTVQIAKFNAFLSACAENPSHNSVSELYDFVVANNLKVTPTGTIILYKWVRSSYYDVHSGKFLNKPGVTLFMDRNKVNNNRNETCSNGLHLCSYNYTKFGDKLLLCEVHPKDVVSIPTDYSQSKMRCCQYTVLLDVTEYISSMDKEGDFISRCENLHYNSKLLEIELMKMYPKVRRTFSINGLNDCQGKEESELLKIAFDKEKIPTKIASTSPTIIIDEVDEESLKEPVEIIVVDKDEEDINNEESVKAEEVLKEEAVKEELLEEEVKEEALEEEVKEELLEESEKVTEQVSIKTISVLDAFNTYSIKGIGADYTNTDLKTVKAFFNNIKVYDSVIMDKALTILNMNKYQIGNVDKLITLFDMYYTILKDEVSAAQFNNDHLNELDNIAEDVQNNKDEVKIVEKPKEESILGKAKNLFKKLF